MEAIWNFIEQTGFYMLISGFMADGGWKYLVMMLVSFILLYLAIVKKFEPLLLIGIAICMGSGLGLTLLPLSDEITRYSPTGQVLIIASCGLLAFGIQRYITLGNKRA